MDRVIPTVVKTVSLTSKKNASTMTNSIANAQKSENGQMYEIPFHWTRTITAMVYFARFSIEGSTIPCALKTDSNEMNADCEIQYIRQHKQPQGSLIDHRIPPV